MQRGSSLAPSLFLGVLAAAYLDVDRVFGPGLTPQSALSRPPPTPTRDGSAAPAHPRRTGRSSRWSLLGPRRAPQRANND